MGFLTCIDHLKLSVREMFSKRFVDRGPVKTYNTYIYIYAYIYIKGAIREYSAVGVPPVRQGVPFVRRGVPLAIFR